MKKVFPKSQATAERILAAAERMFAAHGFDGVSLRAIAAAADAQLALIHYHFGSKLDLYRALWAHRFHIAELRQARLERAEFDFDRPRPDVVRELVELYVHSPMKLLDEPGGREFLTILGRELTDPKAPERGVLREFIDPTAQLFLKAFHRVLPELTDDEIALGYRFMTGVVQSRLSAVQRKPGSEAQRIADLMSALPATMEFIIGGWLQLGAMKLGRVRKRSSK